MFLIIAIPIVMCCSHFKAIVYIVFSGILVLFSSVHVIKDYARGTIFTNVFTSCGNLSSHAYTQDKPITTSLSTSSRKRLILSSTDFY